MPGIIDNHTHYDAQITWDPRASPSPALGVTTAIIGNCGFTIAPCRPRDRELVMKNLTQVEGMSLEVLRAGVRWDFETFPQYLDMLERQGSALNIAVFVGHSSLRTYVMGEAATERAATAAEIGAMKRLVAGGDARRRGRLLDQHLARAQRRGRQADALAPRRRSRAARAGRLPERGGARRVHAHQGRPHADRRSSRSSRADIGRPVVIAALLHNSTNPDAVFSRPGRIRRRTSAAASSSARCRAARCRWTSRCTRPTCSRGWSPGSRHCR